MSCSTPNCRGPIPEPFTSVRSPHTAPEPKLNCMPLTPFQEALPTLLRRMRDIPGRVAGDRRAGKVIVPPRLDQLLDRRMRGNGFDGFVFLGHCHSMKLTGPPATPSDAEYFNGYNGYSLIPEHALVSLDLARDVG